MGLSSGVYNLYSSAFTTRIKQRPPGFNLGFSTCSSRNRSGWTIVAIASRDRCICAHSLRRRTSAVCDPRMKQITPPRLVDDLQIAGPVNYDEVQGGGTASSTASSHLIQQHYVETSADATRRLGLASAQGYTPPMSSSGSILSLSENLSSLHVLQRRSLMRPFGFGSSIIHFNSPCLYHVSTTSRHSQPPASRAFSSREDEYVRDIIELAKKAQKYGTSLSALMERKVDVQEFQDILNGMRELIMKNRPNENGRGDLQVGGPSAFFRRRVAELRRTLEDDRNSGRNQISPDQRQAFEALLDSLSNLMLNALLGVRLLIYALAFYFVVLPISRRIIRHLSTQQAEIGNEFGSKHENKSRLWEHEDDSQL